MRPPTRTSSNPLLLIALPLASVGLVVALVFLYKGPGTEGILKTPKQALATAAEPSDLRKAIIDLDSDQDGLPNWEEQLWGSDTNTADTDNDGTQDGDEVRAGRDPTIFGEGDRIVDSADDVVTVATTATAVLGRTLFGTYLDMRTSGSFSPDMQQEILDRAMESAVKATEPVLYTLTDLTVLTDSSTSTLTTYAHTLAEARSIHSSLPDILLLHQYISSRDERAAAEFDALLVRYRSLVDTMRTMPVPALVAEAHLAALNGINACTNDYAFMRAVREDPMGALTAANRYTLDLTQAARALNQVDALLAQTSTTL